MPSKVALAGVVGILLVVLSCAAQETPPRASGSDQTTVAQAQLLKDAEAFARRLFAWGPDVKVQLGPLKQSDAADFYDVPVEVTLEGHKETGDLYVSKDGKTMLRGDIYNMSADPFAANRSKIHVDGSPSRGPADAKVTLVEFADFECPHCQELYEALRAVETQFPQVRVVYKNFPLTEIHPWAETAAIGARCAYEQSPDAFWKVHDAIFDNQDVLSAENVWDKLTGFATQAGLNADTFKACMSSQEAQKAVDAEHAQGVALGVNSTPTLYINGRPMVGGDTQTLEQYVTYELASHPK